MTREFEPGGSLVLTVEGAATVAQFLGDREVMRESFRVLMLQENR
jgi:hypothetical protein